jgi:Ca-activated chloride channel family protein
MWFNSEISTEGENRRFLVDFEVPGMAALGLCQIAEITLEYMNLHEMKDEKITLAVQVNVVPADIASGRVIDPVVSAERMVIVAEQQKAEALKDSGYGNSKMASRKLNSNVNHLRDHIANLLANPNISAESIEILKKEADEIEELARMAKFEDSAITMKRGTESFNRNMRSRKPRDFKSDSDSQNDPTN